MSMSLHFLEQKGELNETFLIILFILLSCLIFVKKDKSDEINGIDLEKRVVLNFIVLIINGMVKK